MSYQTSITHIESAAKKKGIALSDFFKSAQIAASTWTRWKNQTTLPSGRAWMKVEAAARELGLIKKAA